MDSEVQDRAMAAAIEQIGAGLDALAAVGWSPTDPRDASQVIRETEVLGRRLHAGQVGVLAVVERSGVHRLDGHASAKVMVRHCGNLSNTEALRRAQVAAALADLPVVAAAHGEGRLGRAQVERIARVHANRRVREALVGEDAALARVAVVASFREFDAALGDWERLADEDGAGDRAERADADRDFRMPRNVDGSHRFDGGGGGVKGQEVEDVWQRQVQREWEADWADARRRLGDAATKDDLARTDAQRRYDAMHTCMVRGDLAEYGVQARTCTELVIDQVTFERHLAVLFGTDPGPDPRLATWWDDLADTLPAYQPQPAAHADAAPESGTETAPESESVTGRAPDRVPRPGTPGGVSGYRCSTVDGRPLDPTEVVVASLIGQVRRVVAGTDGVALDMSRKARFFTGARQLAVRLADRSCVWAACDVPSSECQCDHLEAFNGPQQGRTSPGNGAPQCGRHNRFKEHGFTVTRDRHGRWHVHRPDGTEIT